MSNTFTVGQRWISHSEPQLGLGIIVDSEGRFVSISFPAAAEERRYAVDAAPLSRVEYKSGDKITTMDELNLTVVDQQENQNLMIYHCHDEEGQIHVVPELELSCFVTFTSPTQRLFNLQFDSAYAYRLRVSTLEIVDQLHRSNANGLLGSRTNLLQHQLYITHEVGKRFAPRVLLADEVGLGKTIEAGMIIHQQLHSGMASRVLIVVPPNLIHQWLIEMLRRFNLHFAIFDQERIDSYQQFIIEDIGDDEASLTSLPNEADDFSEYSDNPFESEQLILCSLALLTENPDYLTQIKSAGFDLLIVDEAHHLAWTSQSSSSEFECVAELASCCAGVLLLTATPESIGHESYFAQLSLLDKSRFHDLESFKQEQTSYLKLNGLVQKLVGLNKQLSSSEPFAVPTAELINELSSYLPDISIDNEAIDSGKISQLIDLLIDRHGTSRILFRNTRAAIGGFPKRCINHYPLDIPVQYNDLGPSEMLYPETKVGSSDWLKFDPRVEWLEGFLKQNRSSKVLLICAHSQTAIELEHYLHLTKGIASSAFHENLSIIERDRAAAYFADEDGGAQLLICSEIGSEGRNFQFAHHLILFDLPLNPDLLEQRIGRLDRIGQSQTIQLHVPYILGSAQEAIFVWYNDGLDQFTHTFSAGNKILEKFQAQLFNLVAEWPGNKEEFQLFVDAVQAEVKRTKAHAVQGKDKLLELNSCRKDIANKIIKDIIDFDHGKLIDNYLEQVFDVFNIDYQEHSEQALIIEPTENMSADIFHGLQSGRMTITTDRQTALIREDIEYISFEHPMLEEVMELILDGELGNATIASLALKNIKPGTVFIEVYYASECLSPKYLQLHRYLPLSPLRLVIDERFKDLSHLLTHDNLNKHCKNVDNKTAQVVITHIRTRVENILANADETTDQYLSQLKDNAINEHKRVLSKEIDRLTSLQTVNPTIRQDEIDFFKNQINLGKEHLQRAVLKLQALRVIVSV